LAGAICGSDSGHALAKKFLGTNRVPSGYMRIYENHSTSTVRNREGQEIGKLSFRIGLKDFWIEHYYEESVPWLLGVDAAPAGSGHARRQKVIDWAVGRQTQIPFVELTVEVLQYLASARPALLEITQIDGEKIIIPAEVGREVPLKNSKGSLRIAQVFSHLIVQPGGKVTDLPDSNANPALKIEFDRPGKEKSHLYVYARQFHMHGQQPDGVKLQYLPKADSTSVLPAMEVLVGDGDKQLRAWLMGRDLDRAVSLSLTPLLGAATQPAEKEASHKPHPGHEEHARDRNTYLVMARRSTPIKDYKSRLAVFDEDNEVAEKDIEVNDPLYYGGYHFYQHSYDDQHGQYTVLFVKSDTGLWSVYAGFFLLCAGVFWLFWIQPAWAYLIRRRDYGS
ncbi:MAG: cytochrome c biogenesis protein ResB, partial [Phycisphaerae bacterium]|nr:cytochrome c biogenesis protein ResB [Phycisphaerae bacterium]